jgi:hypothetical protein
MPMEWSPPWWRRVILSTRSSRTRSWLSPAVDVEFYTTRVLDLNGELLVAKDGYAMRPAITDLDRRVIRPAHANCNSPHTGTRASPPSGSKTPCIGASSVKRIAVREPCIWLVMAPTASADHHRVSVAQSNPVTVNLQRPNAR